ncbi:rhamnulose-1-phosphate aldolase/alcohol dehydrogenase [Gemmatirosa kalamazoonensis]|uniref:Rhamnulose-1-phosphate aldolase/alcohol dehydrogenase n=1 Tax=Gemmatirosa kalamazoonensis TaxID=861299 RepID=W0RJ07_9BACT|nr:bifunctional rhamnulose-1-phosphate aldolase/short-chain dehydrogenase [Gemmatirosa kalamazoonensis]AHG89393.1 rhamnulose-1-phosphate aldolase/alcohol dehydrogenase [Gemmatirosa kalamazoonensis]
MTTTTLDAATAPPPADDYLRSRWDDAVAARLDPVERLIYRSNLLGADARITNTGGGNTSSKLTATDPLTGQPTRVLWVKGSGGDLRTATKANFASLYLDQVLGLRGVYERFPTRGAKTPAEDAMVGMYPHTTFDRNPTASSIDTPLHAFIPYAHVDHMHPVAVIALATAADGPALTREVYGDDVVWTEWQRPGFELGLELERVVREHPHAKGAILGQHGLINWANDDRECYELTLDLIRRAQAYLDARGDGAPAFGGARARSLGDAERRRVLVEILPWLRGKVSADKRQIATVETRDEVVEFVSSADAPRLAELGTSCPDHFLRTKIKPLYVEWDPQTGDVDALKAKLEAGLAAYQADYADYYGACRRDDSPAMRASAPSVILVPGVGMIAFGKSKSESRVTAEFYNAAIGVMRGAERVSRYRALDRQEAFDIEYWLLEEAKLRRMPPEKALDRQVVVVVGAASGIGRALLTRLVSEGASVAAVDLHASGAEAAATAVQHKVGLGIGVAGTGISGAGQVVGLGADMTDREAVRRALEEVTLAYGGIDHVVVTAGYYPSPDAQGRVADTEWARAFAINVTGPFLVADEAWRLWKAQGLAGSLVITTSVNGVVPKAGSFAYDTSKAAANHLVRELAVAFAPTVRVNGVAPATVIEGSSMFPRDRVIASLAKYKLPHDDAESTETLRDRLAAFYAKRTLTGQAITLDSQVSAIVALVGDTFSRTTGQIVNVDGGLAEAFLR